MRQGSLLTTLPSDSSWRPEAPPEIASAGIKNAFLDFETTGLRWWAGDKPIGAAWRTPDGRSGYVPWGHKGGGNISSEVAIRWLQNEFKGVHIENLNTKFEVHMAHTIDVDFEEMGATVGDVGHYAGLLDDHRRRFSLEELSQDLLGIGKIQGLDVTRLADYHAGDVAPYAMRDVELAHKLRDKLQPMIDSEELNTVQQLENQVIYAVAEMERNANPMDMGLLERWVEDSEQAFLRCLWEIHRETGVRVSPDSAGDMKKLFDARGIQVVHFTPTGQPSFADDILGNYRWDPMIALAQKAKKLASLRSKYILKYWESAKLSGLLRTAFHQMRADEGGTVTGRFSSSALKINGEMEGANVQQVMDVEKQRVMFGYDKKDSSHDDEIFLIRKLYIPNTRGLSEKAKKMIRYLAADAKQIEYRMFASYSRSKKILKAYADDPNVSFHEVVWEMVKPFAPDIAYKNVKNLNFAKLYGAGINKIAEMLGLEFKEAQRFVMVYDRAFPEVKVLLNEAMNLAEQRGYVRTVLGRRSRFPNKQRIHKALNGVIQGGAADVMKRKLVELHQARKRTGFVMRMTVHDEVTGDCPDEESAKMVAEILNRQSFPQLKVPILWDVKTGANWAEC